jgi:hypothetical protein
VRLLLLLISVSSLAQQTIVKYLSGTDKDNTVLWDFKCSKDMKNNSWTKIPVPSNWEQQGFGTYNYKYLFKAEPTWHNKKIIIVFEGVMTDAEVKINFRETLDNLLECILLSQVIDS